MRCALEFALTWFHVPCSKCSSRASCASGNSVSAWFIAVWQSGATANRCLALCFVKVNAMQSPTYGTLMKDFRNKVAAAIPFVTADPSASFISSGAVGGLRTELTSNQYLRSIPGSRTCSAESDALTDTANALRGQADRQRGSVHAAGGRADQVAALHVLRIKDCSHVPRPLGQRPPCKYSCLLETSLEIKWR